MPPIDSCAGRHWTATSSHEIYLLGKKLLFNSVRKNAAELNVLLNDDFIEFGTSGRTYDKKITIELLAIEDPSEVDALDFKAIQLSVDVVQLRFKTRRRNSDGSISASLRSSIWKRTGDQWQMLFHQGTATTP